MSLPARTSPVRLLAAAGAALVAGVLAGCAPADSTSSASGTSGTVSTGSAGASASPSAAACTKDQLKTRTAGKLTIATDKPVYEPWFKDDKPENGQGFESAVAYAVAKQLGYGPGDVTWTRVPFDSVTAPGPKNFDFDINEVSITDKRKQVVDFSSGYYDVAQAVITTRSSKVANAKSVADLKDAKIGAQVGTTSYDMIKNVIKPKTDPAVFNRNEDAVTALGNGQIDALVVDLPTAFYITGSGQVKNSLVLGQFPDQGGTPGQGGKPEQFGLVLDKGSPLTFCVSQAVDTLHNDFTLTELEQQWLTQSAGAPVLH